MAASALCLDGHHLLLAGGSHHRLHRVHFFQRRCLWLQAVKVSSDEGGGRGGVASAVEKRSRGALGREKKGEEEREETVKEVGEALELR
jgi:hypothetical protein